MFRKLAVQAIFFLGILFYPITIALAAEPEAAAPHTEHTHLLGDWGGARSALAQQGIIVDYQATQFYQGVVDGSAGTDDWQYGVKGDFFLTVIGEKAGLWKGLIVNAHVESRAGDDVNALSGLSPANVNLLTPNSGDTTAITQALAIQMLGKQTAVVGGKINANDFVDMVYHTGRGIDGFMNTSLVFPIGLGGTVPLALPGVGALKFKGKEVQGAVLYYGPNNCITTSCLDQPFEDSAVAAIWKFYTGSGQDGARAGYISFGGTYSFKDYTVVDSESFAFVPGQGLTFEDEEYSWSIFSVVNQPLWVDPSNPNRELSFTGMYTYTDGEANPIEWSATAALEMNGPLRRRDKDVVGVGYFHTELSSGFKGVVGPLLSVAATLRNRTLTRIAIEDTDGFEAYYKAQVTPWFALTGNLQVITETLSTQKTKVVAGVRGKVTF